LRSKNSLLVVLATIFVCGGKLSPTQRLPLASGVEKVCSISFKKDSVHPARVENDVLPCLEQASQKLKEEPQIKLVLVGISHPLYDREDADRGMEREGEDMSGTDNSLQRCCFLSRDQHQGLFDALAGRGPVAHHSHHG
jgi:hypothetical protein